MSKQHKSSKETMSNLFNRYVWLVDLVLRRRKITFEEVSNAWCNSSLNNSGDELPLRTFHNHRSAIAAMFDIEINCDKRNGFVYYIENSEDVTRGGVRQWLVNTFAVNNLINESHKLKSRILFEQIPSGQHYLTPIIEAMRDGLSVEITYESFWRNEVHTFPIEPYCVKVFKQRWYVLGRSPYKDELRTYALDRISDLHITDDKYSVPKDFDAAEYFRYGFGIMPRDDWHKVEYVELKVYGSQANYIRTLPLHHSQEEIQTNVEFTIFRYLLCPTYDFRQEILSQGEKVEVLSPVSFREEVAEVVRAQAKRYER